MNRISIEFSKKEYNELLKKIANQLEMYHRYPNDDLKSAYTKLLESNPWKRMEVTPLMEKWASELTGSSMQYYPPNLENSLAAAEYLRQEER